MDETPVPTSLAQICYDIAYFMLPHYAFRSLDKLRTMYEESPASAGQVCYLMACQVRKVSPEPEIATQFRWQAGNSAGRSYLALEYPTIADFTPADATRAQPTIDPAQLVVLPPYWSVIFWEVAAEYYILGQSPLVGTTTVRQLMPDGRNCNLGPGPLPNLNDFLAAIEERRDAG